MKFFSFIILFILSISSSLAACGGTVRTWQGTTTTWSTTTNWSGANVPDTANEDVVVRSTGFNPTITSNTTIGCLEVQAGTINESTASRTLTVRGDYFRAPYANSLNFTVNSFVIAMAGTSPQTFEAVDDIRGLQINNSYGVTLKNSFRVLGTLTLTGSGTTIIEGDIRLSAAFVIPAGHKVIIKNGGSLYSTMNITVNGELEIEGGGTLSMGNTRTLSVPSGGSLKLLGSSGNPAVLSSVNASSWFAFTVAGSISSSYATIRRVSTNGMNVTGSIVQLNNTDFRGMVNGGYVMTLGAAASVPSTLNSIGFYNDDGVATPKNINANLYNQTAITINNISGSVAGATFELDPNNKINWGSTAGTTLSIVNDAEANEPTATLAINTTVTFAEFAFTLNQSATATDITQVAVTMTGSAELSDLSSVKAFRDVNGNCDYDVGTDTQIGSDLVFAGNPLKATITIPAGQLTTNSAVQQACLLIQATSSASPVDQRTVSFSIISASDVVNSQNYDVSNTSGTPVNGGVTYLVNNAYSQWTGGTSTAWNVTTNWSPNTLPSATRACKVGSATRIAQVNTTPIRCSNATLQSGGTLDFNNTTNIFEVYNELAVGSGFNFSNAASGNIHMRGTVNQTMSLLTAFPGNVTINNTGTTFKTVSVTENSTINGNLVCSSGILQIPSGVRLTILGNVTIQTGCSIDIDEGGTLILANGRTLTVNSGGTLELVGSSGNKAIISSLSTTDAYTVIVNGTIKARYYSFERLAPAGVSIEAGATIDVVNFLQDGTFSYPVNSSSTFLKLKRQIPGNSLSNMVFTKNGSSASNIINIDTTGAGAGALNISNYSGDLSGESFDLDPSYNANWTSETNTISITQESTSPASVLTGTTNSMGHFGFQQVDAGSSYLDADITSLILTLTGTGTSTDVSAVRLYSDAACSGSGGTLIGSGTFNGNPEKITFTIASGNLVVPASTSATTKVCAYVEFDISTTATNGNTLGVKINASSDFVNNRNYLPAANTAFPVTLGSPAAIIAPTTTSWTGATSTDWNLASNWSAGVPTASVNCTIANVTNDPIVSTGTATCKTLNITNGILVVNTGASLDVYGDVQKTAGTLTVNGTLSIKDGGTNISHNVFSNTALANLYLAKTGTGTVTINSTSLSINTLVFNSATTTLKISNGNKLVLPNGVTIGQGTLLLEGGGTLEIANTRSINVSGGTFQIAGTNDSFPQNISTKGIVNVTGAGTNSFNFTATSGTVDLVGFQFDRLGVDGLNIGGTTTLANLRGGQFTNLSTTYASVKGIQLNNSGGVPSVASNIAWVWGNWNSFNPANAGTPTAADSYKLVTSTGCNNGTIDFTGWSGDWFEARPTFNATTKISTTSGCTINMGASASAVGLMYFMAVPFDRAIDVRWRTNAERNHLGFNVYRADLFSPQYQQINKQLIRNLKSAGQNQASYRFVDRDVENGKRYYYYIEDVEVGGKKTFHGPIFATAESTLGNPPTDNIDENSDSNDSDSEDDGSSSPTPVPNPAYEDLGNGIIILSRTNSNLRIKITPEHPLFSTSSWDGRYENVSIAGYSQTTTIMAPEVPEKDILIEVGASVETVSLLNSSIQESLLINHLVAPAPDYVQQANGQLRPLYKADSVYYSQEQFFPSSFFKLANKTVKINNRRYISLKINPIRSSPFTQRVRFAKEIVLDVDLDDGGWDVEPPNDAETSVYSIANTLKINIAKTGMYQLTYDDFIKSDVEGPFADTSLGDWRLYLGENEIPLEISSSDNIFNSGDSIRFFVKHVPLLESKTIQLILSPIKLKGNSEAVRISTKEGSPVGLPKATEAMNRIVKVFEQNNKFIDGVSLNDQLDHFFYADLVNFPGMNTLTINTDLPGIENFSQQNIEIKAYIKGRLGMSGEVVKHHLKLYLNNQEEGEFITSSNDREIVTFEVPAEKFSEHNNRIDLKVVGSFAPVNDYDFVLVDKVEIHYNTSNSSADGMTFITLADQLRAHKLDKFNSPLVLAYEVTDSHSPKRLTNTSISNNGGSYLFEFGIDDESDENGLKNFVFISGDSFFKPHSISLNSGANFSLRNVDNEADFIIYGEKHLLEAVEELARMRESEGMEVKLLTPTQVYSEFSHGVKSSKALKDFILFSATHWRTPPRYLLILGDGTYDPLDHNVAELESKDRSVLEMGTLPAPLVTGRFIDFSTDNYFVTSEKSHRPLLVVGRLPTNDPEVLINYVEKIRKYEDGESGPIKSRQVSFFADQETGNYEEFLKHTNNMMNELTGFEKVLFDRTTIGSSEATKEKIKIEFNEAPFMISLLGHGAFDRFGDNIFNTKDAQSLSNLNLPVVTNWNCESAYYYDADKTFRSLGEELIFSKGGAILYMGSTTQTTPTAQAKLANNFFAAVTSVIKNERNSERMGDVLFKAKIATGVGSYEKDIVNSFSILGDPTLKLPQEFFPEQLQSTQIESFKPVPSHQKSKFFGCSAFADDGSTNENWLEGVLEFLLYLVLMYFGPRVMIKRRI